MHLRAGGGEGGEVAGPDDHVRGALDVQSGYLPVRAGQGGGMVERDRVNTKESNSGLIQTFHRPLKSP